MKMSLLRYTNGNGAPKSGVVKVKIECTMPIGGALDLFSTANDVTHLEVTPIGKPTVVLKSTAEVEKKVVKGKKARKSKKVKDTRAAWRKDRKQGRMVLNVSETLKNLGLSENELLSTPSKMGTLEHSLKRTVIQRRACASR
jgi:hypothetical protein